MLLTDENMKVVDASLMEMADRRYAIIESDRRIYHANGDGSKIKAIQYVRFLKTGLSDTVYKLSIFSYPAKKDVEIFAVEQDSNGELIISETAKDEEELLQKDIREIINTLQ